MRRDMVGSHISVSVSDRPGRSARGGEAGAPPLPPGYLLDASDPDVLLLLREDGTTVAVFSAMGATAEGLLEAAEEDARAVGRTAPTRNGR